MAAIQNLALEETEELQDDIMMYLDLETDANNVSCWKVRLLQSYIPLSHYSQRLYSAQAMFVVCKSVLDELKAKRALGNEAYARRTRAHEAVKTEIVSLLKGKTHAQLVSLEGQIKDKLSSGEPVDVDYWEGLLKELVVWMSKVTALPSFISYDAAPSSQARILTVTVIVTQAKLKDMHEVVLQNRLEQLRRRQRDEAARVQSELQQNLATNFAVNRAMEEAAEDVVMADEVEDEDVEEYEREMSPESTEKVSAEDRNLELLDELEELEKLVRRSALFILLASVTGRSVLTRSSYPSARRKKSGSPNPLRTHETKSDGSQPNRQGRPSRSSVSSRSRQGSG
jgi:hypothetical protein